MLFQLTHTHTLLKGFFGIETNMDQTELEKLLFYVEAIHMKHMPNLEYVLDDTISESDAIKILPILYKDSGYTFKPIYQQPKSKFTVIDLFKIENSFSKYKPILAEINAKYAIPNATLTLMQYYQEDVVATLKKEYIFNNFDNSNIDETAQNYNREAAILEKILKGEEIQDEWELTSFLQKDLTGMNFLPTQEKETL